MNITRLHNNIQRIYKVLKNHMDNEDDKSLMHRAVEQGFAVEESLCRYEINNNVIEYEKDFLKLDEEYQIDILGEEFYYLWKNGHYDPFEIKGE